MHELGELIRRLSARMSVLLVEHHMDLVMRVCDRITVLDSGKQIAAGTPAEVQADPAVTEAYLGDDVDVEADAAELTAPTEDAPMAERARQHRGLRRRPARRHRRRRPARGRGTHLRLRPGARPDGVTLQRRGRPDHRRPGRERCRQDDAAAHDQRPGPPACRAGCMLGGEDITRAPVEAMVGKGMAHVPEGRGVIAELTVEENLRVGVAVPRQGRSKAEFDRVYDLFPRLAERRNNPAHTLSGGERQMLVIGRALLAQPRILLLDEPSLGTGARGSSRRSSACSASWSTPRASRCCWSSRTPAARCRSPTSASSSTSAGSSSPTPARTLMADEGLRHAYLGF